MWPHDKTLRQPIKDRERLEAMDYTGKLRRVCEKHEMRFVDYRPETGSWVFRVEHFSKYGLNDSDDEDDDVPADPKKAKMAAAAVVGAGGADAGLAVGGAGQTVSGLYALFIRKLIVKYCSLLAQHLGAIPKTASLMRPLNDKDGAVHAQPQGLGGFDARFDARKWQFGM